MKSFRDEEMDAEYLLDKITDAELRAEEEKRMEEE
tara:strand:- start:1321 stop:1425 length:105 start_codon:yes stop_codon:yes gene_type:complete